MLQDSEQNRLAHTRGPRPTLLSLKSLKRIRGCPKRGTWGQSPPFPNPTLCPVHLACSSGHRLPLAGAWKVVAFTNLFKQWPSPQSVLRQYLSTQSTFSLSHILIPEMASETPSSRFFLHHPSPASLRFVPCLKIKIVSVK